ncbi:carbon starvation induced protein [Raoultella terrigena]|uniref:Carbon starvation induced protein n=1 Tax=Raoultella terrigena TaxID=577 RepID=A0A3P8L1V2_RAOTE|nr:carbon starvation induced protein [Raoultella terrigena]
MRWAAPPSKNVSHDVFHPVFDVDRQGRPVMRYIDQFVQPNDFAEGIWLSDLSDALESSQNILSVPVPVGKLLLINNLFWLHGRDRFTAHPDLRRGADAPARLHQRCQSPLPAPSVSAISRRNRVDV